LATPTDNSVPVTYIDIDATGAGKYLAAGEKWGDALGTGVTLTYSFTNSGSVWAPFYSGLFEPQGWSALSANAVSAVRSGLAAWAAAANVNFTEVADNVSTVGEIRIAKTMMNDEDFAGWAYYPSSDPLAGDVWFSSQWFNKGGGPVTAGSYDYLTIIHELGHALGLKHSFETPNVIPAGKDNYLYTIMSYTASPWSNTKDNYASFYPTTPMYYDLVAIQALYGKNTSINAGNNVYTFNDGTHYWQAINDAGGHDAIVYNGVENSVIDLNPAHFSSVSETIKFNGGSTRATVTIGPDVVIEDARGGSGNDKLIGNSADNTLNGRAGADNMRGGGGNDVYVVDGAGDIVNEGVAGSNGIDTVRSLISFSLVHSAHVLGAIENLTLIGSGKISATGNALNNVLVGNAGANVLHGGAGADTIDGGAGADNMFGGAGNNVYVVNKAGDIVNERVAGSSGIDTVQSSISFSLVNSAHVLGTFENLTLIGSGNISGTGNALSNVLTGNAGANVLNGGAGADTIDGGAGADNMRGGAGNDVYVVDNAGDISTRASRARAASIPYSRLSVSIWPTPQT
jgi:serralysin